MIGGMNCNPTVTRCFRAIALLLAFCAMFQAGAKVVGGADDIGRSSPTADAADWPMYNHDVAGWRFNSAEKMLGPGNVGGLVEKWRFPAADSQEALGVVGGALLEQSHVRELGTAPRPLDDVAVPADVGLSAPGRDHARRDAPA